jgi:hypothetical protein
LLLGGVFGAIRYNPDCTGALRGAASLNSVKGGLSPNGLHVAANCCTLCVVGRGFTIAFAYCAGAGAIDTYGDTGSKVCQTPWPDNTDGPAAITGTVGVGGTRGRAVGIGPKADVGRAIGIGPNADVGRTCGGGGIPSTVCGSMTVVTIACTVDLAGGSGGGGGIVRIKALALGRDGGCCCGCCFAKAVTTCVSC